MAPITASQSMRMTRTTGNLSASTKQNIKQTYSDPMNLKTVNSNDSSVFSGLASVINDGVEDNDENKSVRSVRFEEDDDEEEHEVVFERKRRSKKKKKKTQQKPTSVGKYKLKACEIEESASEDETSRSAFISIIRSGGSGTSSERSALRNLQPVADNDSAFMDTTTILTTDSESILYRPPRLNQDQDFLYDQDASTMSYGSVNEFPRPRGILKLVSKVELFDDLESDDSRASKIEEPGSPQTPEGASAISNLLKTFEKEMDANLSSINEVEESLECIPLSDWQDVVPRMVTSEDERQSISFQQAKQMQLIIHQARKEVETLRDNNEQFMSEIEQTEEEHDSETKLNDERMKQKISELKAMYQEEMESVIQEKDAAITEAGRQAARYAEYGRKHIATLKKQVEKLKQHAGGAVKQAVEDAAVTIKQKKDNEMTARLGALRKSYESELEKTRNETESKIRAAVNEAVVTVTQKMLTDRDRGATDIIKSSQSHLDEQQQASVKAAVDASLHELEELRREREGMLKAIEDVKANFEAHYPDQMGLLRHQQDQNTSNPMKLLQSCSLKETTAEKDFKEVVAAFAFLLEQAESNQMVASAEYIAEAEQTKSDRNDVYHQARKDLMLKHRNELDYSRKHLEESKDKIERLEQSLKTVFREKRALQEKFRKDGDSHRNEVQRLQTLQTKLKAAGKAADDEGYEHPFLAVRDQRKVQETEASSVGRDHFMKPKQTETQSLKLVANEGDVLEQNDVRDHVRAPESPYSAVGSVMFEGKPEECHDDIEVLRSPSGATPKKNKPDIVKAASEHNRRVTESELQSTLSAVTESSGISPSPPPSPPKAKFDGPPSTASEIIHVLKIPSVYSRDKEGNQYGTSSAFKPRNKPSKSDSVRHSADELRRDTREEPVGEKDDILPSEKIKQKSVAILRSFKSAKSSSPRNRYPASSPRNRDPVTSTQGKDPEGKGEESTPSLSLKNRMSGAGRARNFFDTMGEIEKSHHRRGSGSFTDEGSLSSLKADPGVPSPRSKSMHVSRSANASIVSSKSLEESSDKQCIQEDTSEHTRSTRRKKRNPLGMFANRRRRSMSPCTKVAVNSGTEDNTQSSEIWGSADMDHNNTLKEITPPRNDEDISIHSNNEKPRSMKRPPLSGFDTKKSGIVPSVPHVINGKKPPLPEWSRATDKIYTQGPPPLPHSSRSSDDINNVPTTIDVRGNRKKETVSLAGNGHTMCLRPMPVETKGITEGVSCISGESNCILNVSSGETSTTFASTEDDRALYTSQGRMRQLPPLGDDDSSYDDSSADLTDKYESAEPPAQFARDYPSPKRSGAKQHRLVASRRVKDGSSVIYMDPSNDSKPIVVQGQPIYRKPALSAFTPRREISENSSTAGSEATTTITAHTFRSSFNTTPNKLREFHHRNTPSTAGSFSKRANSMAALKARRARRQAEF